MTDKTLYYNLHIGDYFRKIETGKGRFEGMCLWQRVKRVLGFFYVKINEPFWLDEYGFIKVNRYGKRNNNNV